MILLLTTVLYMNFLCFKKNQKQSTKEQRSLLAFKNTWRQYLSIHWLYLGWSENIDRGVYPNHPQANLCPHLTLMKSTVIYNKKSCIWVFCSNFSNVLVAENVNVVRPEFLGTANPNAIAPSVLEPLKILSLYTFWVAMCTIMKLFLCDFMILLLTFWPFEGSKLFQLHKGGGWERGYAIMLS